MQRECLRDLSVLFFIIRKTGLTTLLVGELSSARFFLRISQAIVGSVDT